MKWTIENFDSFEFVKEKVQINKQVSNVIIEIPLENREITELFLLIGVFWLGATSSSLIYLLCRHLINNYNFIVIWFKDTFSFSLLLYIVRRRNLEYWSVVKKIISVKNHFQCDSCFVSETLLTKSIVGSLRPKPARCMTSQRREPPCYR